MNKTKKIVSLMLCCIMLFGITLSANAANNPDAPTTYGTIYRSCPTCKTTTPFDECGICGIYDKNNPYHCRVCGTQMGHSDWSSCPAW